MHVLANTTRNTGQGYHQDHEESKNFISQSVPLRIHDQSHCSWGLLASGMMTTTQELGDSFLIDAVNPFGIAVA